MLAGFHFYTATALALGFQANYLSSILIGIASHHLLDRLPHLDLNIFNKKYKKREDLDFKFFFLVSLEFLFFLFLTFYFIGNYDLEVQKIIVLGGLAGLLPDCLDFLNLLLNGSLSKFKLFQIYSNFHHKHSHFKYNNQKFLPLIIQISIFLLSTLIFLGYH